MAARHVPPSVTTAAGYVESEVSAWIHGRIKGEPWAPGSIPEHPTIIRLREVKQRTGLSNFTLWTLEQRGEFPKRIRLTDPVSREQVAEPPAARRFVRRAPEPADAA